MQPTAPMRLALAHTLEPAPMIARILAADGGSYAWTDDADLYPDGGAVVLRRPHIPPVVIWSPSTLADAPAPAEVIAAIIAALDEQTWGVVDVRALVERMVVTP